MNYNSHRAIYFARRSKINFFFFFVFFPQVLKIAYSTRIVSEPLARFFFTLCSPNPILFFAIDGIANMNNNDNISNNSNRIDKDNNNKNNNYDNCNYNKSIILIIIIIDIYIYIYIYIYKYKTMLIRIMRIIAT